ncbi:thioredoxin family protein [Alkalihalobacillus oceani]|uniref:thioredoxin family protein n=1 Tax=Halalkalibacter oceani TaxID=1653776 RepID=UPI00203B2DAE|nr:thioredoxin family protein [Halalkalibacter oceani]MCM3760641.1 thioredoxin family protein [Halalkalibacter oceani]
MKKLLIYGGIVVVLFAALAIVTSMKSQQASEGNPFGKDRLDPGTIKQLDDPLYQNIILPDELEASLANGEDKTIYFYSPNCQACQQASPVLVPAAEEAGVNLELLNVLEFDEAWADFGINVTPTVIHFENGEEESRLESLQTQEEYEQWLSERADSAS